ncbi:MAG: electron transport complex subunit RsxC [Actinobacteria bacterium]|nr:electron transport complex subunit RsxC [Actinomycetota bacterium]
MTANAASTSATASLKQKGPGTFRRGVHPPENKALTADKAVKVLPNPVKVLIALLQHTGRPAELSVKPRDSVELGQKIAEPTGLISAAIHASIAGKVGPLTTTVLPNGVRVPAVSITAGEADNQGPNWPSPKPEQFKVENFLPEQIVAAVQEAGLVGLGGAAFPTHVKLMANPERPIDTVILNGCECEPYLTSDYRLMLEEPQWVVAGLRLAVKATGANRGLIAIEDNKPQAIAAMQIAAADYPHLQVQSLQTKYPQGGERSLLPASVGRVIPTKGLPLHVGVVVLNVGTAAALAKAVLRGAALTHRVITVTGEGISEPANLLVPIGVALKEVLINCGGLTEDAAKIIMGGTMMGNTVSDLELPITKGTSGVTVLTKSQVQTEIERPCVRCAKCVDHCPIRLNPTSIAQAVKLDEFELAGELGLQACVECGSCAYICPSRIPLVQYMRSGKAGLRKIEQSNSQIAVESGPKAPMSCHGTMPGLK